MLGAGLGVLYGGIQSQNRMSRLASRLLVPPTERELKHWRATKRDPIALLAKGDSSPRRGYPTDDLLAPIVRDISSGIRGAKRDPENIGVKTAVSLYFAPSHGFDSGRNRAISVKYGVSIVSPFYERELYNVGLSVPWYYKTPTQGLSKPLLRRLAIRKRLLPREVVFQKKMGLGSSRRSLSETYMGIWVKGQLQGWIANTLSENMELVTSLISQEEATRMIEEGRGSEAFMVLMFVLWYKRYLGDRGAANPKLWAE